MAILKGGLFGDIKGKLSNVVIRKVKGKCIGSVRPLKYKKTKSKKAKNIRSKFSIAVEFSKYINSIPILKDVWANADIKNSSPFNMIEKFNIKKVNDNAPSLQNIISPPIQINNNFCNFPFGDICLDEKEIVCRLNDEEAAKPLPVTGEASLLLVLLFFDPKNNNDKYYMFGNIACSNYLQSSSGSILKIKLSPVIKKKIFLYNKLIIYAASIIPGSGKIKYYSSLTFSKDFNLESI